MQNLIRSLFVEATEILLSKLGAPWKMKAFRGDYLELFRLFAAALFLLSSLGFS
jgi:hypothetical protein